MSLSLANSRVEFRFNVGSGPVAISSDVISLHTWYTLRFRKDRHMGQLLGIFRMLHVFRNSWLSFLSRRAVLICNQSKAVRVCMLTKCHKM